MLALTAFYTLSRGGAIELAVALAVLIALHPRRLTPFARPWSLAGAGGALAIAAATQRDALADGLTNQLAASQARRDARAGARRLRRSRAPAGRALARGALRARTADPTLAATTAGIAAAVAAVAAVAIAVAAGVPGESRTAGTSSRHPAGARFDNRGSGSRAPAAMAVTSIWQSALDANATDAAERHRGRDLRVLVGSGMGRFRGSFATPTRSTSRPSAELGIVGLRAHRRPDRVRACNGDNPGAPSAAGERALLAAAAAGCFAFATAAAIDWAWELAVLPVVFLMLAAGIVARRGDDARAGRSRSSRVSASRSWRLRR